MNNPSCYMYSFFIKVVTSWGNRVFLHNFPSSIVFLFTSRSWDINTHTFLTLFFLSSFNTQLVQSISSLTVSPLLHLESPRPAQGTITNTLIGHLAWTARCGIRAAALGCGTLSDWRWALGHVSCEEEEVGERRETGRGVKGVGMPALGRW